VAHCRPPAQRPQDDGCRPTNWPSGSRHSLLTKRSPKPGRCWCPGSALRAGEFRLTTAGSRRLPAHNIPLVTHDSDYNAMSGLEVIVI
jgi:hypothetical protein